MIGDDLDDDVSRLAASGWLTKASGLSGLDAQQEAMATKLAGKANVEALERRAAGETKPFRPIKIVTRFEWYRFTGPFGTGWRIYRSENGVKIQEADGFHEDHLQRELRRVRSYGHAVQEIILGAPSRGAAHAKPSRRRAMLDRIGKFRA